MTREDIDNAVKDIFGDLFDVPPASITPQTSPDTLLEWDSLAHVRLIAAFEEKFDMIISADNQVEMLNVELIGDVLNDLKNQGA